MITRTTRRKAAKDKQIALLRDALDRISEWRGFRHTGEVRDCAAKALRGKW